MRKISTILILIFSIAFALSGEEEARRLFQLGDGYFLEGSYLLAREYYQKVSENYRDTTYAADSQFRLGEILYRTGSYDLAYRQFELVEEKYPTTRFLREIPYWLGVTAFQLGDYSRAERALNFYLDSGRSTNRDDALLHLGASRYRRGDMEGALPPLEAVFQAGIVQPYGYIPSLLGVVFLETGRYNQLAGLLGALAPRKADSPWRERLLFLQAELDYHRGGSLAPELYLELLSPPGELSSVSYQRLFSIYMAEGEGERMEELLARAERDLQWKPAFLQEFWFRIGVTFFGAGEYPKAEEYLRKAYSQFPEEGQTSPPDPQVPLYLAKVLRARGELDGVVEVVDNYFDLGGEETPELWFLMGEALTQLGEWGDALECWEQLSKDVAELEQPYMYHYYYGYCLYRTGAQKEALLAVAPIENPDGGVVDHLRGDSRIGAIRLLGRLHFLLQDYPSAVRVWQEHVLLTGTDPIASQELLRSLYLAGRYDEVISYGLKLKLDQELRYTHPEIGILATYLSGLGAISLGRYTTALEEFGVLGEEELSKVEWEELFPYVLYYRGWASYRSSRFEDALSSFLLLSARIESSNGLLNDPTLLRSFYLAGWCAYQLGDYSTATEQFLLVTEAGGGVLRGGLMAARSMRDGGRENEAATLLTEISTLHPESELNPTIMFELGEVQAKLGEAESATSTLMLAYERAPDGRFSQESLYRRGEIYMEAKRWQEAEDAFYLYRRTFPGGKFVDASLYWGGESRVAKGDSFGGVVLWEGLVARFPDSSFRGSAMWKTGEFYRTNGDYLRALDIMETLVEIYPGEARDFGAPSRIKELNYLMVGTPPEEASLRAKIQEAGGAEYPEGRELLIELGRLLIYRGGRFLEEGREKLEEVLFYKEEDPPRAARALFHLAEYHQRRGSFDLAMDTFIDASVINVDDVELMARAIFRAGELALRQGDRAGAEALAQRLSNNFLSSPWSEELRLLLDKEQSGE